MAGIPLPLSSRKISLTFAWPSYRTTHDLSPQQPNAELAARHLSEPYRNASFLASAGFNARWPTWAHGYLAQLSEVDFPLDLAVYVVDEWK
jgi:hypothetical protein